MAVYKIAFSGAHSTGKTTAFNAVYRYLSDKGFAIYPIQGIARSSPFPLNKDATPEGQRWIFYKQAMLEEEAALKIRQSGEDGVILCERSIFDNLVYSFYLGTQGDLTQYKHNYLERLWHFNKDLAALAEKLTFYKPSTLLFRTILREGIAVETDNVRDTDLEYRNTIHQFFDVYFFDTPRINKFGPYIQVVPYVSYEKTLLHIIYFLKDAKRLKGN